MILRRGRRFTVLPLMVALSATMAGCSAEPTDAAEGGSQAAAIERSASQMHDALNEFSQGAKDAHLIDDEELRRTIPAAQSWLKDIKVNPAECGPIMDIPLAEQLAGATMALLETDEGTVAAAAFKDTQTLNDQLAKDDELSSKCTRYTVLRGDKHVAYHLAKQPVSSGAEYSCAHLLTSSDGSAAMQQMVVRAAHGNLMVTISQPLDRKNQAQQLEQASEDADRVLELVRDQQ